MEAPYDILREALYDILKTDSQGKPIWVEAVGNLQSAKSRVSELIQANPGQDYVVFSQKTQKLIPIKEV